MTKFVVTDEDGNISYNAGKEAPEAFSTFTAARRRAQGLASFSPGKPIRIYELVIEMVAPVGSVTVTDVRKNRRN